MASYPFSKEGQLVRVVPKGRGQQKSQDRDTCMKTQWTQYVRNEKVWGYQVLGHKCLNWDGDETKEVADKKTSGWVRRKNEMLALSWAYNNKKSLGGYNRKVFRCAFVTDLEIAPRCSWHHWVLSPIRMKVSLLNRHLKILSLPFHSPFPVSHYHAPQMPVKLTIRVEIILVSMNIAV